MTRRDFENYIKSEYPNAVFDYWLESKWGCELQFYPTPNANDVYSCIIRECQFVILDEF